MTGRQPLSTSSLASHRHPVWSSVRCWLLRLQSSSIFALAQLPAPAPVLHMSAPVRRTAVADARMGGSGVMFDLGFLWFLGWDGVTRRKPQTPGTADEHTNGFLAGMVSHAHASQFTVHFTAACEGITLHACMHCHATMNQTSLQSSTACIYAAPGLQITSALSRVVHNPDICSQHAQWLSAPPWLLWITSFTSWVLLVAQLAVRVLLVQGSFSACSTCGSFIALK